MELSRGADGVQSSSAPLAPAGGAAVALRRSSGYLPRLAPKLANLRPIRWRGALERPPVVRRLALKAGLARQLQAVLNRAPQGNFGHRLWNACDLLVKPSIYLVVVYDDEPRLPARTQA